MLNNYLDLNYSFKLPFDVVKDTDIKKQIFEKDYIMLLGIESEKEISKILEKNADKHIIILRNRYLDKRFINRIIDCAKNKCKKIIFQIKDKEKSSCLFDEVETKQLYENANLLKQNGFDVAIYSKGYQYEYKIEEVLNANRILHNWANLILNATVEGRRLSAKERYLFAYMTVINYFNYNIENVGDPAVVSRTAINVLNGDKIVCTGFAEVLSTILNLIGIPSVCLSVKLAGNVYHSVCLVYIDDELYNEKGFLLSDPTCQNLLYSFISLQEIDKLFFKNFTFVDKNSRLEEIFEIKQFLKNVGELSLQNKTVFMNYLFVKQNNLLKFKLSKEKILFNKSINKVVHGILIDYFKYKNLSATNFNFVKTIFGYNTFEIFKRDINSITRKFKNMSTNEMLDNTVKFLLNNKFSPLSFNEIAINDILKNLSGQVNFNENVFINVLKSMGISNSKAKKVSKLLIVEALNFAIKESNDVSDSYLLNLNAQTENYFLKRLKNVLNEKDGEISKNELLSFQERELINQYYSYIKNDKIFLLYFLSQNKSLVPKIRKTVKRYNKLSNVSIKIKGMIDRNLAKTDKSIHKEKIVKTSFEKEC